MASGKISDMNIYLHVLNQVLQKDKGKTRKGCTKTLSVLGKNMCENSFIFATVTTIQSHIGILIEIKDGYLTDYVVSLEIS